MIEVRSNGAHVGAFFKGLAAGLTDELGKRVLAGAQHATGEIRKAAFATFPHGRTGQLPRSFRETFIGWRGAVVSAAAHSDLVYARILDDGGTIRPKSKATLAVPLSSANVPLGKWPRHWGSGQLIAIKRKGKRTLLATTNKRGEIQPKYVLVLQVVLRGRHYIQRAADAALPGIEKIIGDGLEQLTNHGAAE